MIPNVVPMLVSVKVNDRPNCLLVLESQYEKQPEYDLLIGPNVKGVNAGISSKPGYLGINSEHVIFHPRDKIININALKQCHVENTVVVRLKEFCKCSPDQLIYFASPFN